MAVGFYFSNAFRNIWNNKRQSFVFLIGLTLSLTVIISLSAWSSTASTLAIRDLANDQDYDLRVRSYIPSNIPIIKSWLDNQSLIDSTALLYHNLAFFNAEDKNPFYRFFPLDDQEDNEDPVTLTTLFLFPNQSIERISNQVDVEGEFALGTNDVLISRYQADQMKEYLNVTVEPGMVLNLTVCRQSVDFGIFLFQYEPINFYNITVRGIYSYTDSVSMMQQTFSSEQIQNSIIFLKENMLEEDIERMEENGLFPILVAKCDAELLVSDGIEEVKSKLEAFADSLYIEYPTSLNFVLTILYDDLLQTYSRANTLLVVLVPVILLGIIQAILMTNIILENRKMEIEIYKEKGGQKWQIIGSILIEFTILSFIAILVSIISSLIIASLIPAIASQELTLEAFADFFTHIEFSYLITAISSVAAFLIVSVFVILKINQILSSDISERDLVFRDRSQKLITIITLSALTGASIITFTVFTIVFGRAFRGIYTFTINNTQRSSLMFITLSLALLFIAILLAIGLFALLGRLKVIYNRLLKKNSFFLVNYFRNSKYKLNTVLIVLLIMTSSMFFALTLISTLHKTENQVNYYNNGSDLRIITKEIHHSFEDNITQIEGINEAMSVFKTSGVYGTEVLITVYGIDPKKYSSIGRWIESSFFMGEVPDTSNASYYNIWLEDLDTNEDGAIISDVLIENSPSLDINVSIQINRLPVETTTGTDNFEVKGIIHSAPGLGLSSGINLELEQPNNYFMLINEEKIYEEYGLKTTNLFFASLEQGADLDQVIADLLELDSVIEVNPELVSEGFTERYVNNYVPSIQIFLTMQIIFTGLIGLFVIVSNIDYILTQRKQETAIFTALGNTNANHIRMIVVELSIIVAITVIFGLIIALPLTLVTTSLIVPFLTDILIIPYSFSINYLITGIIIVSLFIVALIGAIPSIIRINREKTSDAMRDETSGAY
ncbi:MAG: ABC transporter permease [Asgard group archaeon]|nr:ABC transporter permease [Asgard group archaeon]